MEKHQAYGKGNRRKKALPYQQDIPAFVGPCLLNIQITLAETRSMENDSIPLHVLLCVARMLASERCICMYRAGGGAKGGAMCLMNF